MRMIVMGAMAAAVACAILPAAARAEPVFTVAGARGAGPAQYDRVLVQRFGSPNADTVLVLVPGQTSGAGVFTFVARDLVREVPGLQVWAVDRREQAFEDTAAIAAGDPDQATAYYLRGESVGGRAFTPPAVPDVRFMANWGLGLLLGDLRNVVRAAHHGGRRVILGGHSMGASVAEAYASWDFAGRPGSRDLTGLVLVDGGLLGGHPQPSLADARATLADIKKTGPRLDVLNQGRPYLYGVVSAVAGLYAQLRPEEGAALESVPGVPFEPPFATTNATWLGLASQFFYPATGAAAAHAGHPADTGSPRSWVDGDITPIARLAGWLTQTPINTVDWYIPRRLVLDVQAAEPLAVTPVSRLLGLRLTHRRGIRLPIFAFQTSSGTPGGVLRGARRLGRLSLSGSPTLAGDPAMLHFDPLTALPARNTFVRAVTPFLRRLVRPAVSSQCQGPCY